MLTPPAADRPQTPEARPAVRQRALRAGAALARGLFRAVLRAFITWLIFAVCLLAAMRYMGVPVPTPVELLDKFESVSRLAEILS